MRIADYRSNVSSINLRFDSIPSGMLMRQRKRVAMRDWREAEKIDGDERNCEDVAVAEASRI